MYGSYFFYSDLRVEHSRDVMTYWGILGEFGGLQSLLITFFGFFAFSVNKKLKQIKFVTALYFDKSAKAVKMSNFDKVKTNLCCCKSNEM